MPGFHSFFVVEMMSSTAEGLPATAALFSAECRWLHTAMWGAAGLALLASLVGRVVRAVAARRGSVRTRSPVYVFACQRAALFTSVIAGVVVAFLLAARGTYAILETFRGASFEQREWMDLAPDGLIPIGMLIVAVLAALHGTRNRELIAPLVWLAAAGVSWAVLLLPTYHRTASGGSVRSPVFLILALGLAAVLCVAVATRRLAVERRRRCILETDPSALPDRTPDWPGLQATCGALAMFLIVLICYGLVAPVALSPGGYRLASLVLFGVSAAAAAAVFVAVGWQWNVNLADAAMGLTSLAVCALSTTFVPSQPAALADRFPMIFNALVVALAIMTGFWTWISGVWDQQLDGGRPWTTAGHLVKPANRFSFRMGTMGVIVASLMALWPALRPIGATDDSAARMACGIAAHLPLLLALLWSGRKTGRSSFHALAVLTLISLLAFIGTRTIV